MRRQFICRLQPLRTFTGTASHYWRQTEMTRPWSNRFNREQHPDDKFVTNVGLAREIYCAR
jgi:hypothetical protein